MKPSSNAKYRWIKISCNTTDKAAVQLVDSWDMSMVNAIYISDRRVGIGIDVRALSLNRRITRYEDYLE